MSTHLCRPTVETTYKTGELRALTSAISFAAAGIALRRGSEQLDGNAGLLISVIVNALLNSLALGIRIAVGPPFGVNRAGLLFFMGAALVAAAAALAMPGSFTRLRAALVRAEGRQGALWFVGAGLTTSLSQFSLYTALGVSPIWKVNLIAGTEPLIVALMGLALLRGRERQGLRLWGNALLVTAGVAVIAIG